ncbi:MAG: hypothetical protein R2849_15225 [Thermomicrobiales bacterium]
MLASPILYASETAKRSNDGAINTADTPSLPEARVSRQTPSNACRDYRIIGLDHSKPEGELPEHVESIETDLVR